MYGNYHDREVIVEYCSLKKIKMGRIPISFAILWMGIYGYTTADFVV